ncbi:MAG: NAD(P)H-hydrate dehydratase [Lautropia sp.]|nr:NAD(P)H-hydrate dehydratase [Lautropia sp.]
MTTRALTSAVYPATHASPGWLLDLESIRMIEKRWLQETPPGALMAAAGAAVADVASRMWRAMPADTMIVLLVGPGNNGGDALVAGRLLAQAGLDVRAAVFPGLEKTPPRTADARKAWVAWRSAGRRFHALGEARDWLSQSALVIDGLFGIGQTRALEPLVSGLARLLRETQTPVLAIDVPSGLNAETGAAIDGGEVISARWTVTMIADKAGLHTGAGLLHAGEVWVAPLSEELPNAPSRPPGAQLLETQAVAGWLPEVRRDSHKGRAGDVLVIGGRLGMAGAARLAARGALGAGAGRVWISLDTESFAQGDTPGAADPYRPEIMQTGWPHPRTDEVKTDGAAALPGSQPVLVVGCGLGQDVQACSWLEHALASGAHLVIDADALSLIAARPALLLQGGMDEAEQEGERSEGQVDGETASETSEEAADGNAAPPATTEEHGMLRILTPHPLEAARLLNESVAKVQADRIEAAQTLARRFDAVVVLKGAGSVVALPCGQYMINSSGHPLLGTAGSGDVLAGTIAALLARLLRTGVPVPEAAWRASCIAVWLHGRAGEWLADRLGPTGVAAAHLADCYPAIWAELRRVARDVVAFPASGQQRS